MLARDDDVANAHCVPRTEFLPRPIRVQYPVSTYCTLGDLRLYLPLDLPQVRVHDDDDESTIHHHGRLFAQRTTDACFVDISKSGTSVVY